MRGLPVYRSAHAGYTVPQKRSPDERKGHPGLARISLRSCGLRERDHTSRGHARRTSHSTPLNATVIASPTAYDHHTPIGSAR